MRSCGALAPAECHIILPLLVAEAFLQTMPAIAECLAADFQRALSLLKQPVPLLRWREVGSWLRNAPELHHTLEQQTGIDWQRQPAWPTLWQRFWSQNEQEYAARMYAYLCPQRLLVVSLAHFDDADTQALARLREHLARDPAERGWTGAPPDVYLFEEPLIEWVLRPLLVGEWLAALCQQLQQAHTAM